MENTGLSVADFMAMSKSNDGFGSGIGWLILILLFFFFFSGNGLFGRDSAQGLTLTNLERDTLNGQKTIEASILTTSCNTQKEVLDGNYATLLGFKDQQAQMAQCCLTNVKATIREILCRVKTLIFGELLGRQSTLIKI